MDENREKRVYETTEVFKMKVGQKNIMIPLIIDRLHTSKKFK